MKTLSIIFDTSEVATAFEARVDTVRDECKRVKEAASAEAASKEAIAQEEAARVAEMAEKEVESAIRMQAVMRGKLQRKEFASLQDEKAGEEAVVAEGEQQGEGTPTGLLLSH